MQGARQPLVDATASDSARVDMMLLLALIIVIVGHWVPAVFLQAADNVDEEHCEHPFLAMWLKIDAVVVYIAPLVVILLRHVTRELWLGRLVVSKLPLVNVLVAIGWATLGSQFLFDCTSASCSRGEDRLDPYMTVATILPIQIIGFALVGGVIVCTGRQQGLGEEGRQELALGEAEGGGAAGVGGVIMRDDHRADLQQYLEEQARQEQARQERALQEQARQELASQEQARQEWARGEEGGSGAASSGWWPRAEGIVGSA